MTHPDPPRAWPRPVEEVARALCNRRVVPMPYVGHYDAWGVLMSWASTGDAESVTERDAFLADAQAAITRMIDLGFVLPSVFEAMKAEKDGK